MSGHLLLTFNPGSSTIKLGLFAIEANETRRIGGGIIDLRNRPLTLHVVEGPAATDIPLKAAVTDDLHEVIDETLSWLKTHFQVNALAGVGHRVVHGGDRFAGPEVVSNGMLQAIEALVPLAPLHQPQSIRLIRAVRHLRPGLLQVASFDTAFHRSQSDLVRRFALPRVLFDQGVKRYGFHGLSYKSVALRLERIAPEIARGRVVAAHLGSGASLCGMQAGISYDTSMGFSTLDGVPMATRCGTIDPGILIHLVKERGVSIDEIEDMLYHRSGLLGISGISADSRDLIVSAAPEAREALNIFTFRIAREIAALATALGGLDGIVFTGGVGEHQPLIRSAVCGHLAWLGATVDDAANSQNATRIDASGSQIPIIIVPTDEEQVIADEARSILATRDTIQQ